MASLARGEDFALPVCFFLAPMDPKRDKNDVELVLEVVIAGWRTGANPMAVPKRRRATAAKLADFIVAGSVPTSSDRI